MRIGVVTTSFPRTDGDPAGAWVAEHAAYLAGQGHDVEVIAAGPASGRSEVLAAPPRWRGIANADPRAAGPLAPSPSRAGGSITVTRLTGRVFDGDGGPEAFDREPIRALADGAAFSARLVAMIASRGRRWDAAIAHWLLPSAMAVRLAAPRIPLVAIAHSGDVHLARRLRLTVALAALAATRNTEVVFVSRALRGLVADATPPPLRRVIARSLVQPMGIDLERFAAARSARPRTRPRVVFLGRLVPIKGADLLVRSAARSRHPLEIIIAGRGPEEAELRCLLAAQALADGVTVEFRGEVRGADRDRLLADADVVVIPSRTLASGREEGSPRVALEAMAAGAAVLATATGGLRELPAATVTLVPPDDEASFIAALEDLLVDPRRRARQAAAGARYAATQDWSQVGSRLIPSLVRGPA